MQISPINNRDNIVHNKLPFRASSKYVNTMNKFFKDEKITDDVAKEIILSASAILAVYNVKLRNGILRKKFDTDTCIPQKKDKKIVKPPLQEKVHEENSKLEYATPEEFQKHGLTVTSVDKSDGLFIINNLCGYECKTKKDKEKKEFVERHFHQIKGIDGYASFYGFNIKDLCNLEYIGGSANFAGSNIENIGKLKHIGKDGLFSYSKIKSLNNLETIGGTARFDNSQLEDIGELQRINKHAYFKKSKIVDLKNLETIGGSAHFDNSTVKNLNSLTSVEGNAYFSKSNINDLGNLTNIGGKVICKNTPAVEHLLSEKGFTITVK